MGDVLQARLGAVTVYGFGGCVEGAGNRFTLFRSLFIGKPAVTRGHSSRLCRIHVVRRLRETSQASGLNNRSTDFCLNSQNNSSSSAILSSEDFFSPVVLFSEPDFASISSTDHFSLLYCYFLSSTHSLGNQSLIWGSLCFGCVVSQEVLSSIET